jgi:hypothetical protein
MLFHPRIAAWRGEIKVLITLIELARSLKFDENQLNVLKKEKGKKNIPER